MIKLNLIEKKKPFALPSILGMDLSVLNFKMLAVSILIYYSPGFISEQMFDGKIEETKTAVDNLIKNNAKIKEDLSKDGNVQSQYKAYKEQVSKLQNRSSQVDEILKNRTNPKKILEKIARSIPEDVWFTELIITNTNEIIIKGGSFSPRSVGEFITTINDSPYFSGSITPASQENKREILDGNYATFEQFELRGRITNYDMRAL
ncbi:MAG: PilN domain-containing protein [Bdellovibrionales bacterium]|nr:PilN domain-containing protein [Bdellovibrionales bacterium]